MSRFVRSLYATGALFASGCTPVHFPMAVAASPTHITYAQRRYGLEDDYLVDCAVDPMTGQHSSCDLVALPKSE